jgi:hypothetical protein
MLRYCWVEVIAARTDTNVIETIRAVYGEKRSAKEGGSGGGVGAVGEGESKVGSVPFVKGAPANEGMLIQAKRVENERREPSSPRPTSHLSLSTTSPSSDPLSYAAETGTALCLPCPAAIVVHWFVVDLSSSRSLL